MTVTNATAASFAPFSSADETVTRGAWTFEAETVHDSDHGTPWENEDGHGPVSEWTNRAKRPGELILSQTQYTGMSRCYDYAEACRIARRDGWGVEGGKHEGETARQYAARAAMADYDRLRRWCDDQWSYVGVVVTISAAGVELARESLWGIESDAGEYLVETANELAEQAIEQARETARAKSRELAELVDA